MNKRPKSITFIAWFLIITAAISLPTTLLSMNDPVVIEILELSPIPISMQYVLSYVGLTITITSGIFMLRGANWARFLYIITTAGLGNFAC